jgi:YYY domain-containing protein
MQLPLLLPLCLGALAFLNTWDFPIYLLVFGVAYGFGRWARYGRLNWPFVRDVGLTGGAVAILGLTLYLPFYIGFQSQAGGLLPTLYVGTRFRQYFVMFGPFLVAIAGLLALLALRLRREMPGRRLFGRWMAWTATFLLVPLGIMVMIVLLLMITPQGRDLLENIRRIPAVYEIVGDSAWVPLLGELFLVKLRTWVMPLVVAGMAALGTVLLQRSVTPQPDPVRTEEGERRGAIRHPSVQFVLVLAVIGLLLTLSVEFFYLVDNFRVRMNTIFKFYFQAWVLMAVASTFAVYWLSRWGKGRKPAANAVRAAFIIGFWLLFAMGMVYPVLGNVRRAEEFATSPRLDGTAYLAESQPDDHAAVAWLNEQVEGAPVILEKPGTGGSSYVYEGRVAALTGLPTLLGWGGHEGQWRGDYTVQAAREPDIEILYNTLDPEAALTLLDKYDITYVYVGPLERIEYDPRGLQKFGQFMDVVYQNEGVTIYRVR